MGRMLNVSAGDRFGRLVIVAEKPRSKIEPRKFDLRCDCGKMKTAHLAYLRAGNVSSCGCLRSENSTILGKQRATHGESHVGSTEYISWRSMKDRCLNPKQSNYGRYGGAGIRICDEWVRDFSQFLADMGRKPTSRHTLDRIDSSGNYEPSNCRWATPKEQANNRRRPRPRLQMEA